MSLTTGIDVFAPITLLLLLFAISSYVCHACSLNSDLYIHIKMTLLMLHVISHNVVQDYFTRCHSHGVDTH